MYIIDVIPLIILPPQAPQIVSYFHNSDIPRGSLVEIPYNRRKIMGISVSSLDIEKEKTSIKKSSFQLQKIKKVIDIERVFDYQLKDAKYISQKYSSALGITLKSIIPPFSLLKRKQNIRKPEFTKTQVHNEKIFISGSIPERIKFIKSKIQNRDGQLLLLFPDSDIAQNIFNQINGKDIFLLNSRTKNVDLIKIWNECISNKDLVVIGTRQSLFLPFSNLNEIIIDDPQNEMYKSEMTPKYETLDLAIWKSEQLKSSLTLIGSIPSIEIWHDIKNGIYEHKILKPNKVNAEIVSMAEEIVNNNFSPLAQISKKNLIHSLLAKKKVLIYSSRRGFASMLGCSNCGQVVVCPNCSAGLRVYKSETLELMCHHCGYKTSKPNNCSRCHDYNLKPVGFGGSQKLFDEVRRLLEINELKVPVLIMDTSVIKNEAEESEIMETLTKDEPSVLIATEMISSHKFNLDFETIIVPFSDSIWSFPDFRSEDKLIYVIENLKSLNPKNLIIQTINPESNVLKVIESNNYDEYVNKSLKERKAFHYPPFSRLVRLSYSNKDAHEARKQAKIANEKMKRAISYLKLDDKIKIFDTMPSFIHKVNNMYRYNIVFKVLDKNLNLSEFLAYTPARWIIDVDTRNLL